MIEITWLGHATFQFRLETGEVLLLDPWTDGNPAYPKGHSFSRVDAMLITHGHGDHIHSAVPLAHKFLPQVVAIFDTCEWLSTKGVGKLCPMNKGGSQVVAGVTVTMTHALHSCGIKDDGHMIYGGDPAGYVLRFPDGRAAYFAGDTDVFTDMQLIEQLHHPELAFLPIGDLYTMGPKAAALAASLLKPKKIIPMHFGTFPVLKGTPGELAALLPPGGPQVWPLTPGKPVQW